MDLELRLLRSFAAIVDAGSLTRAAASLHISQQSLSQQLQTLEAQVGAQLLERSSRGVSLTPVGAVLEQEARGLLEQADRVAAVVGQAANGGTGELRIGFLSSIGHYLMPPVVRGFRQRHPGVTLYAVELSIAELVDGLRRGTLDAALSRPPLVDDLDVETVLREPVAAVLPEGHALADRETLDLAELADDAWVLTAPDSWPPWHAAYQDEFAAAGFVPRVVQRGTTPQNLLALVAAGTGVTRLALSTRNLRRGGVAFVPIDGAQTQVVLTRHPSASSPVMEAFAATVRDVAAAVETG